MSPVGTPHPPQFSPSVAQTLNYLIQTTRLKFDIFQLIHDMQIPHSWCWNPSPRALWLCWAIWSCRSKKQGAGDRPSPGFVKSFSLDLVFTDTILTFQKFPSFLRFWSFKVLPWVDRLFLCDGLVAPITPSSTPDSHHSGPLRLRTSSWSKIATHPPPLLTVLRRRACRVEGFNWEAWRGSI